jgi:hypothetical protein
MENKGNQAVAMTQSAMATMAALQSLARLSVAAGGFCMLAEVTASSTNRKGLIRSKRYPRAPITRPSAAALADHKETLICSKFVYPCGSGIPVHITIRRLAFQTVKDIDFGFREPSVTRG